MPIVCPDCGTTVEIPWPDGERPDEDSKPLCPGCGAQLWLRAFVLMA